MRFYYCLRIVVPNPARIQFEWAANYLPLSGLPKALKAPGSSSGAPGGIDWPPSQRSQKSQGYPLGLLLHCYIVTLSHWSVFILHKTSHSVLLPVQCHRLGSERTSICMPWVSPNSPARKWDYCRILMSRSKSSGRAPREIPITIIIPSQFHVVIITLLYFISHTWS